MNELKKILAENPQAKEEFENIVEVLNLGATGEIKRLVRHIGTFWETFLAKT